MLIRIHFSQLKISTKLCSLSHQMLWMVSWSILKKISKEYLCRYQPVYFKYWARFGKHAILSVLAKFLNATQKGYHYINWYYSFDTTQEERAAQPTVCYGWGITATPSNNKGYKTYKVELFYSHEENIGKIAEWTYHGTGMIRTSIICTHRWSAEHHNHSCVRVCHQLVEWYTAQKN